jgi:hypothetical protein
MKFTRGSLKGIEAKVLDAVKEALDGTGISVSVGGGRFSESEFNLKVVMTTATETDVDGRTEPEKDFIDFGEKYGLTSDMLWKVINYHGKFFTISGLYPNRPKNNVAIKNAKGKVYIAPSDSIKRAYNEMYSDKSLVNE